MIKTVENYIDNARPEQIPIIMEIRSIMQNNVPNVIEKISYGIPFYYYLGPLCYINPRKGVVDLGFTKGYALSNKQGILEQKGRAQVCTISFKNSEEIYQDLIIDIINEAIKLNELYYYAKKGR